MVAVGDFAVLAAMAAEQSEMPAVIHALSRAQADVAIRQGHETIGLSLSVIKELGAIAFPGVQLLPAAEATASVTPLFAGTATVFRPGPSHGSSERISRSNETTILSQGA